MKVFPFDTIVAWYEKNGRHDLPWRHVYDLPTKERLYKIWIAEVMLQQTQVDRVISYYTKFLKKYPTIESLAETTYDELFPYYQGLGYYGRARRMIDLAKVVVEKYGGIFPDDFEKLRKLPGVGKYTAQALLAFGYDKPVLAVDANLTKIFCRYYFGNKNIFSKKKEKIKKKKDRNVNDFNTLIEQLEKQLQKGIEKKSNKAPLGRGGTIENKNGGLGNGRSINNALMDFGAWQTTFDKIEKKEYPLKECKWFLTEGKSENVKRLTFNIKRLTKYSCLVFLHENHKLYFSSTKKHFEPFLIEPIGRDDRRAIQDYFSTTFGLEVSVRPSFGSGYLTPGLKNLNPGVEQMVKLFHAQIQTGQQKFTTFPKSEKEEWIEKNLDI